METTDKEGESLRWRIIGAGTTNSTKATMNKNNEIVQEATIDANNGGFMGGMRKHRWMILKTESIQLALPCTTAAKDSAIYFVRRQPPTFTINATVDCNANKATERSSVSMAVVGTKNRNSSKKEREILGRVENITCNIKWQIKKNE
nr:hypothetical protein Iba_chr02bCG8310 [Ipomoea batatas]